MDFDIYQTEARRTRDDLKGDELRTLAALGIAGEGGEVADLIKKAEFHGHVLKPVEVAKELGDLLWYIATMADGIGWTLADVARLNVEKLRERYPDGFDPERSQNRSGNAYLDSLCGHVTPSDDGTDAFVCIEPGVDGGWCQKHQDEGEIVDPSFEVINDD